MADNPAEHRELSSSTATSIAWTRDLARAQEERIEWLEYAVSELLARHQLGIDGDGEIVRVPRAPTPEPPFAGGSGY
jgi:hypothetical protein